METTPNVQPGKPAAPLPPFPNPVPAMQAMPDHYSLMEQEISLLKQRQKWQMVQWWALFILILCVGGAFAFLHFWDSRELRREARTDTTELQDRMDKVRGLSLDMLNERARSIEARLDGLQTKTDTMRTDVAVLKGRMDGGSCSSMCLPGDK